ncbi:hypothetical protein [Marinobacter alkaliphilus]|uniref:hypothetical protein n=1 Tax=Marinobacter alkaliphilus TaxID=254719 RepID=UPI00384EB510
MRPYFSKREIKYSFQTADPVTARIRYHQISACVERHIANERAQLLGTEEITDLHLKNWRKNGIPSRRCVPTLMSHYPHSLYTLVQFKLNHSILPQRQEQPPRARTLDNDMKFSCLSSTSPLWSTMVYGQILDRESRSVKKMSESIALTLNQ